VTVELPKLDVVPVDKLLCGFNRGLVVGAIKSSIASIKWPSLPITYTRYSDILVLRRSAKFHDQLSAVCPVPDARAQSICGFRQRKKRNVPLKHLRLSRDFQLPDIPVPPGTKIHHPFDDRESRQRRL
jgi:hypothetical protein